MHAAAAAAACSTAHACRFMHAGPCMPIHPWHACTHVNHASCCSCVRAHGARTVKNIHGQFRVKKLWLAKCTCLNIRSSHHSASSSAGAPSSTRAAAAALGVNGKPDIPYFTPSARDAISDVPLSAGTVQALHTVSRTWLRGGSPHRILNKITGTACHASALWQS
jgi:hypothetical protein